MLANGLNGIVISELRLPSPQGSGGDGAVETPFVIKISAIEVEDHQALIYILRISQ